MEDLHVRHVDPQVRNECCDERMPFDVTAGHQEGDEVVYLDVICRVATFHCRLEGGFEDGFDLIGDLAQDELGVVPPDKVQYRERIDDDGSVGFSLRLSVRQLHFVCHRNGDQGAVERGKIERCHSISNR